MEKKYYLKYENGVYFFEYSRPENDEGRLEINEKDMALDSALFYKVFFEKVNEEISIEICNDIPSSDSAFKKGQRIYETMQKLCDEICKEINSQCFSKK